jgi:hypothetical protein
MGMVWVQQVDILYTKSSRGAPAATARNKLPRAFSMQTSGHARYAFEHYRMLEWEDFVPKVTESGTVPSAPGHQGDLVIEASEDIVRLGLRWNRLIGQPRRYAQLNAMALRKGQSARLMINGRYTNHSGQFYTEATYNVAFSDTLRPDVFLGLTQPLLLDMRADLF